VTRSHKFNDKDHAGLADGTVLPHEHVPKFFAKNGFADADPKKTKKNGGGRGNWYVELCYIYVCTIPLLPLGRFVSQHFVCGND